MHLLKQFGKFGAPDTPSGPPMCAIFWRPPIIVLLIILTIIVLSKFKVYQGPDHLLSWYTVCIIIYNHNQQIQKKNETPQFGLKLVQKKSRFQIICISLIILIIDVR